MADKFLLGLVLRDCEQAIASFPDATIHAAVSAVITARFPRQFSRRLNIVAADLTQRQVSDPDGFPLGDPSDSSLGRDAVIMTLVAHFEAISRTLADSG